jgi:hypothetical protein
MGINAMQLIITAYIAVLVIIAGGVIALEACLTRGRRSGILDP